MNQLELNQKLYNEFEKADFNEKRILELLKQGANPLGIMNSYKDDPYGEIIYENKNLDKITKVLLDNGMIIDNNNYQTDDMVNPLWELALRPDTIGIKTLKLLLDYHTEINSIEVFVNHIYTDYIFLDDREKIAKQARENNEIEVEKDKTETYFNIAMKMLMLCASYEYIIDNSKYLKDIISYNRNNKDSLKEFRKYSNFYLRETQTKLHFYNKKNHKLIWTIYYYEED